MAGNGTTEQGSAFDLDLETEKFLALLESIDDDTLDNLGIGSNGSGVSSFSGNLIYLKQSPHTEVAYEWQPPTDCQIELLSRHACVVVDSADGFRTLDLPGGRASLNAGTPTKFSVISSTGEVELKIHEKPIG